MGNCRPGEIVKEMIAEGHARFTQHTHMLMWQAADARNPVHDYGTHLKPDEWLWYSTWVDYVRAKLTEDAAPAEAV